MVIKKINPEDTYTLRQMVLRPGLDLTTCKFPMDHDKTTFHLGSFCSEKLVSIATFQQEDHMFFQGRQYRLRGMATHPHFRKQGHASSLIKKAEEILLSKVCEYLWFNARTIAMSFYQSLGYSTQGSEFQIQGVGPHYLMFKHFNKC